MMAAASASLFMWPGVRSVGASSLVLSPWIRHLISRLLILRSNIGRIAPRRLLGCKSVSDSVSGVRDGAVLRDLGLGGVGLAGFGRSIHLASLLRVALTASWTPSSE